ncbi:MAG: hypothetical protein Q9176_006121 [Flavoplaca citrina]
MSSTGTLGPLETLLLLQGLQTSDPGIAPFGPVSERLKAHAAGYQKGTPNVERFEPKSLELLYLRLLKDEPRSDSQKSCHSAQGQDNHNDACDGKLESPPMETMEEARHYRHLIPQLATRVYESHRESAIKSIEEEERKYQALKKDIQEIERGDWETRIDYQDGNSSTGSKNISSIQTLLQDEPSTAYDTPQTINGPPPVSAPPSFGKDVSKNSPHNVSISETQPQVVPDANDDAGSATPNASGGIPQSTNTAASASPKRRRQPLDVLPPVPSNAHRPPSQPTSAENGAPFLPPPLPPNQAYSIASPSPDLHRRPSSQPANIAPSSATRPHPTPRQQHPERSSGSPIILPPPPGMLRSNSSTSGPLDPLADIPDQILCHLRVHLMLPAVLSILSSSLFHQSTHTNPINIRNMTTVHLIKMHTRHTIPVHYQLINLKAIRTSPLTSIRVIIRDNSRNILLDNPIIRRLRHIRIPYNPQQGQVVSPYGQYAPARPFAPHTPVYAPDFRRKPKPSPINTSVSSTKWKKVDRRDDLPSPKSPIPPGPDEISPISEKAPSPGPESTQMRNVRNKAQEGLSSLATEDLPPPLSHSSTVKRGRGRPRGSSNRGRGGRAASIASSAIPARSRSPSIASGADELSLGPPTSAGNRSAIKPEPPATPARDSSASIPPTALTDDGSRKSTRRRRGTLRGREATAESTRLGTKRKRTLDTSEIDSRPVVRSELEKQRGEVSTTHILASRNFPRTSATLMNDISAHKLASIFAKPLTEREAPGYPFLIYRSQDLKSIKQAITVGNRALTAFIEQRRDEDGDSNDVIPMAGASEGDARVWVKKNEDFMPPKGIVNSAQLEKEIMRVFANAVMFNPDPKRALGPAYRTRATVQQRHVPTHLDERADDDDDEEGGDDVSEGEGGIVKDAREMFEDVEKIVGQWRAAERAAEEAAIMTGMGKIGRVRGGEGEEEDVDELAGDESGIAVEEEEVEERAGKRRRR